MSDSGMSTHSIKGEDHYKCREVKAERDLLRAEVERLRGLLKEAADYIEETVEATYYGTALYPDQQRRKERDMDLPRRIRAALEGGSDEP